MLLELFLPNQNLIQPIDVLVSGAGVFALAASAYIYDTRVHGLKNERTEPDLPETVKILLTCREMIHPKQRIAFLEPVYNQTCQIA